jgi:hypothetical protein
MLGFSGAVDFVPLWLFTCGGTYDKSARFA